MRKRTSPHAPRRPESPREIEQRGTRKSVDDGDEDKDVSSASTAEAEKEAGGDGKKRESDSDNEIEVVTGDEGVTGNGEQLPLRAVPTLKAKEKAPAEEPHRGALSPMPAPLGRAEHDDEDDPAEAAQERVPRLPVVVQRRSYPAYGTQDKPEYLHHHMDELIMHHH